MIRRRWLIAAGLPVVAAGATLAAPPAPRLVWNASASAPIGLYGVSPGGRISRGATVIAWTPASYRHLAAIRRYIPENVPLVKRVAGMAGDRICALGNIITINGHAVAERRAVDAAGRAMPRWKGCLRLRQNQLFLLMAEVPGSFDGRYFGPTDKADVIGPASALWIR